MGYVKGDSAHFHTEFRDPHTGALVDPTTVKFKYEPPGGAETTLTYGSSPELTKQSTGRYQAAIDLNVAGTWGFRWETTGTYKGADEFTRQVEPSQFT
jgi:hypothetical protein